MFTFKLGSHISVFSKEMSGVVIVKERRQIQGDYE